MPKARYLINPIQAQRSGAQCGVRTTRCGCGVSETRNSKLYNIPSTGLRFFTIYGPAGRPDMAYFGFTNKLLKGETIQIYNYGNCRRDFTYVDDIVEGIGRVMQKAPVRMVQRILMVSERKRA